MLVFSNKKYRNAFTCAIGNGSDLHKKKSLFHQNNFFAMDLVWRVYVITTNDRLIEKQTNANENKRQNHRSFLP